MSVSKVTATALALLIASACNQDLPSGAGFPPPPPPEQPPPPPVPLPPVALSIVGGDGQAGRWGDTLALPFVVRVSDAEGKGVPGIDVLWTIVAGSGTLQSSPTVYTDAVGVARSRRFAPTGWLQTQVSASIGRGIPPVTFTVPMTGVLIRFGPLFDCVEQSFFSLPDSLPVGTTVEWSYWGGDLPCQTRIVSASIPEGASAFDSGTLNGGDHFSSVLYVVGDWEFVDVLNGGSGVLRVR